MTSGRRSFLALAANTPWVYALARGLVSHGDVTAVRIIDWMNNARLRPQWPETRSAVDRIVFSMPPGYAGSLEPLFRPLMRSLIDRERARLRARSGNESTVICPYPFIAPWVRHVPGDKLVYYNLDDYALYHAQRVARNEALENELIERAALTVCLSHHQVESLRRRLPHRAGHIEHFPLGVVHEFLNPAPAEPPEVDAVGYVGNMTDRVDWRLVKRVAELMPDTRFHFIGNAADGSSGAGLQHNASWTTQRAEALAMPNVVQRGPAPQHEVPHHYRRYFVNWMPYDSTHPFNIASCPTKIMDALASGRPFLCTDIPEVRTYPGHLEIASSADEAARKLRAMLAAARTHDAASQVEFARSNTWDHRAARFVELSERLAP